jgi:hypothetical protein
MCFVAIYKAGVLKQKQKYNKTTFFLYIFFTVIRQNANLETTNHKKKNEWKKKKLWLFLLFQKPALQLLNEDKRSFSFHSLIFLSLNHCLWRDRLAISNEN